MNEYNGTDEINMNDEDAVVAEAHRLVEAGDFDAEMSFLRRVSEHAKKRREAELRSRRS